MKIINRKQLSQMPNGTVFMLYSPKVLGNEIHIITGKFIDEDGYNGEILLTPYFDINDIECTNWCSNDTTDWEYDDNQLFAVFSKLEIQIMIQILQWSLTGCEDNGLNWFEDCYIYNDVIIPKNELSKWTNN